MDSGSSGQPCCSAALASLATILRQLAFEAAPDVRLDHLLSAVPAPHHLPMYYSLHASLKPFKKLSQQQLEKVFRHLPLAITMFSSLPLRTYALSSRFTDASRCALNLSNALQYTAATVSDPFELHSRSLLIAYAPAFHAISPSPQSLDLSCNSLTDEHADIIASTIIPHTSSILSLDISGNPGLCIAALAFIIDPLTHLTRFCATVPAAEATPAALSDLLDVAGTDRALAVLALVFPPLPQTPTCTATDDTMREDDSSSLHTVYPSAACSEPASSTQQVPPDHSVPNAAAPPAPPPRFKALQHLSLVNLPPASEAAILAAFPLSQLRMLNLSADMHAEHAQTPSLHPLGSAAVAALSATPTRLPQLKALDLHGRSMHASHAHDANSTRETSPQPVPTDSPPAAHTLHPFFHNLPKLTRVDAGSVPFCTATGGADSDITKAPEPHEGQAWRLTDDACTAPGGSRPDFRALAAVATSVSPDLPETVSALTALTALDISGIICHHHADAHQAEAAPMPRGKRRQESACGGAGGPVAPAAERVPARADAWGRAVLPLTKLQSLKLAHACMCWGCAAESAASAARALVPGPPDLEALALAWHIADSTEAVQQGGTVQLPLDSSPGGLGIGDCFGPSGASELAKGHAITGFSQLVTSLGLLTALTSLTLCVPVRIPWHTMHAHVSRLSVLQQLALQADAPPSHARASSAHVHGSAQVEAVTGIEGAGEGASGGAGPAPTVLDVTSTVQGLSHLTALTALRLNGVGAVRPRGGAEAPPVATPAAGTAASVNAARGISGSDDEPMNGNWDQRRGGEAGMGAAGSPSGHREFDRGDAERRLAASVKAAASCIGHMTGQCRICGVGRDAGPLAAARPGSGGSMAVLPGMQELVLKVATGVGLDVGAVCSVVAGMGALERLEVSTGGGRLKDGEKRRIWESAQGAPLLRGLCLC